MKVWPTSNKPARFSDLAGPIVEAIRFAYKMRRRHTDEDIPWHGLEISEKEQVTCLCAEESLSADALAWCLEDQGRDALEEIIGLALRLGIEQGRRLEKRP